jgi:uncharacterized membrane protein YcfT
MRNFVTFRTPAMSSTNGNNIDTEKNRVVWVDYAKGICIIMVVMMHSTLDYGQIIQSEGWLHHAVAFARPFRMPDFFLLSGLFLARSIHSPTREYIDRKLLHFVYFYLIWLVIQLIVTEPEILLTDPVSFISAFFFAWVEPINTLWFVHMLAIFYMITRLVRYAPKLLIFLLAASLQTAFQLGFIDTGWSVPDRFFDRYVYFFAGYATAPWIFSFARQIPSWPRSAVLGLTIWAVINAAFTVGHHDSAPGFSLILGFLGAAAIVTAGALLADRPWTTWLGHCGANSIVIYLSFFLPMKIALFLFARSAVIPDAGSASLVITMIAVAAPLIFYWAIKDTWLTFLYHRPTSFKLPNLQRHALKQ